MACSLRLTCAIFGAWLCNLTFGTVYCWGNLAPYVVSYLREFGFAAEYSEMSWAVSITTSLQALSMCFCGLLHQRFGLKPVAGLGGILITSGVFFSSFTIKFGKVAFLIFYAGLFGLGLGLAYMTPMLILMKWLPSMKGLASGLVVAAFGAGACLFNEVQQHWINPHEFKPSREVHGFKYFDWSNPDVDGEVLGNLPSLLLMEGILFFVMQGLGIMLLLEPLEEDRSAEAAAEVGEGDALETGKKAAVSSPGNYTTLEMVQSRPFWTLLTTVFFNCQVVLIMNASQKTFGQELLPDVKDSSLTNIAGAAAIMNGLGRLFWGLMADLSSWRVAMVSLCIVQAGLVATLPLVASVGVYGVWLCGIFNTIGGNFALFPTATSLTFGIEHMGSNYGVVFLGVAVSELLASAVLQFVLDGRPLYVTCEMMAVCALCGAAAASQLRQATPGGAEAKKAKLALPSEKAGYGSIAWPIKQK